MPIKEFNQANITHRKNQYMRLVFWKSLA